MARKQKEKSTTTTEVWLQYRRVKRLPAHLTVPMAYTEAARGLLVTKASSENTTDTCIIHVQYNYLYIDLEIARQFIVNHPNDEVRI